MRLSKSFFSSNSLRNIFSVGVSFLSFSLIGCNDRGVEVVEGPKSRAARLQTGVLTKNQKRTDGKLSELRAYLKKQAREKESLCRLYKNELTAPQFSEREVSILQTKKGSILLNLPAADFNKLSEIFKSKFFVASRMNIVGQLIEFFPEPQTQELRPENVRPMLGVRPDDKRLLSIVRPSVQSSPIFIVSDVFELEQNQSLRTYGRDITIIANVIRLKRGSILNTKPELSAIRDKNVTGLDAGRIHLVALVIEVDPDAKIIASGGSPRPNFVPVDAISAEQILAYQEKYLQPLVSHPDTFENRERNLSSGPKEMIEDFAEIAQREWVKAHSVFAGDVELPAEMTVADWKAIISDSLKRRAVKKSGPLTIANGKMIISLKVLDQTPREDLGKNPLAVAIPPSVVFTKISGGNGGDLEIDSWCTLDNPPVGANLSVGRAEELEVNPLDAYWPKTHRYFELEGGQYLRVDFQFKSDLRRNHSGSWVFGSAKRPIKIPLELYVDHGANSGLVLESSNYSEFSGRKGTVSANENLPILALYNILNDEGIPFELSAPMYWEDAKKAEPLFEKQSRIR